MTINGRLWLWLRMSARADRARCRTWLAASPPGARRFGSVKDSWMICCQFSRGSADKVLSFRRGSVCIGRPFWLAKGWIVCWARRYWLVVMWSMA